MLPTVQGDILVYREGDQEGVMTIGTAAWFAGLVITYDIDDNTVLRGPLVDEAALHGVLIKVRDLALPLLEVHRVEGSGAGPESHEAEM